ncbi:MAG: MBOAT family protein [Oscillospiraceae bacterium]|jgi:alginate O-acetyltransferase complex protein AlgI|nr:MBOAT family protein [Oscillospiraceae bacterium]
MVFSSLNFLFIFFPLVLLVYFIAPRKLRNLILFLFSLVFYAWGEPIYVSLMLFSTVVDYVHGRLVDKYRGNKAAKAALISSVVINLALLGVFKYSDFVVASINGAFGLTIPQPNLPLPIGISFYTFQTMSYTIDVYRGDAKMQKNIISFGTYVALFPQLIAGPIVRFQTVAEQLNERRETPDMFSEGIRRFIAGLGKKVLLANNIGMLWTQISALAPGDMSVLGAWLGIVAFAFQIYFDFSGYSDMAIGLGKMFGFTFLENFDYPYISKSITEFWRRWHISLGTWFREYVYIPLGGNRHGLGKQLRNIAIVWILTGIWHGASWNFAVWGVYYCILLIFEKVFLLKYLEKMPAVISRIYTLLCVLIGWVIFAFDDLGAGLRYTSYLFGGSGVPFVNDRALFALTSNMIMLILLVIGSTPLPHRLSQRFLAAAQDKTFTRAALSNVVIVFIFLISVAYLVDSTYNPFLYFRF